MTGQPPENYPPYGGYEPPGGYSPYQGGGNAPPPQQGPYGGYPPPRYPPPVPPQYGGYPPPVPQQYGGYPPPGPYGQPMKPNSHLIWSIITIFLCMIPGVVATVYAAKVDGLWAQGRYAEATSSSNNAKTWAIIASVLGGFFVLLWLGRVGSHTSS